jgi:hypothetical protein
MDNYDVNINGVSLMLLKGVADQYNRPLWRWLEHWHIFSCHVKNE